MKLKAPFKLFGILGYPLSHTLSPAMQEAAFKAAGLKAFYSVFEIQPKNFLKLAKRLHALPLDGFNVTVPYKESVKKIVRDLTPEAKMIGAVNTVFRRNGKWAGTNTDVHGFLTSLREEARFNPKGKTALVFGAGGAARAVLYGLAEKKAECVFLVNRNKVRAKKLALEFEKLFPKTFFEAIDDKAIVKAVLSGSDLVINATSLGLNPKDPAVMDEAMICPAGKRPKLFFDLIYKPAETRFLRLARLKGHKTLNGLGMLLYQGAKAFECWTGKKAPVSVMRKTLLQALANHD